MPKTAVIHARMDPQLKLEVEAILHQLGLNTTDAINLFFQQVKLNDGMPFPVKVPNALTRKTIQEADKGINVVECKNIDETFEKLGI